MSKKTYETPRLDDFGSIADMTLTGNYDFNWNWLKKWKKEKDICDTRFAFLRSSCASS
jgi:hypothetical protein